MSMVAHQQRIASAFTVFFGAYGDVSRYAEERGVCRQWVYREADWVAATLNGGWQAEMAALRARVEELEQDKALLQHRLSLAVVLDDEKQSEFACAGEAIGASLPMCYALLDVLIPGKGLSVPTLGRRTKAAGEKAGQLLAVFDEWTRPLVCDADSDEIYVKAPVLMVVEPQSLCWVSGRLSDEVSGAAWRKEFGVLPNLEQVTRDGGKGLEKGIALVNDERRAAGQKPVVDQGDHFHALWHGGVGLRKAEARARKALQAAEAAQAKLDELGRQGQRTQTAGIHAGIAWRKAEQAMDEWVRVEQLWRRSKEALRLFTPEGALNTRAAAEHVLAETLPQLPDDFAKSKQALQKPEMLNYLDRVQEKLQALPYAEEVKQAAVRQEELRRHPELKGEGVQAAAVRSLLLVYAAILAKAGQGGADAVAAVQKILRTAHRASSLVECINSVLRMQHARHRKMTQGLIDLKRLWWNCHTFRTGRRRKTTPYERLGVPWPAGLRWWELLKLTPEQLREKLSTAKLAA
jgi:hypothetical protein